jgi:hypothetical protein
LLANACFISQVSNVAAFVLTIFTGAFLLFGVQPLIGKYILPWFGGATGVWTTCMLFFQVVLMGGYTYAHFVTRWFQPRAQAIIHLVLVASALALLPIVPSETWKPVTGENPTARILALLTVTLGLPYFVLSSTGPLMQHWFSKIHPDRSPYRLFALSNAGSLLALISYPFFFEIHFTRRMQASIWGWGLGAFAIFCGFLARQVWKSTKSVQSSNPQEKHKGFTPAGLTPPGFDRVLWLLLPACASVLLVATTNKMCQDVAVMPFLWVLPLALYLLSFILCFDSPRWYKRNLFMLLLVAALGAMAWAIARGVEAPLTLLIGIYSAGLFICCVVCHGELYRLKPNPRYLTSFYLVIAVGGALGGFFVAVIAPLIFHNYYELHWGMLLCGLLFIIAVVRCAQPPSAPRQGKRLLYPASLMVGLILLGIVLWFQAHRFSELVLERTRNFYGVLTLFEAAKNDPDHHHFSMAHGHIIHGLQIANPIGATFPTGYYNTRSGVGLAILALPHGSRRIGLVGTGVGTLAAYSRTNDYFRAYEINPDVLRLATSRFTYIAHCHGKVDLVLGDARLSLEKEASQHFDLLALDAFTGDAIPAHLLTKEAFQLYERHLNANGVIAVHVTNHYLDLEPALANIAGEFGYSIAVIECNPADPAVIEASPGHEPWWIHYSIWVLLAKNKNFLDTPSIRDVARPPHVKDIPLWTDDFSSLYQVLR